MVTLQFVLATTFALLLVVIVCNGLVDLYVRAAVRDALDDGVRAAAPGDADATMCQQRAETAIGALVHGVAARGVSVRCSIADRVVHADAELHLPSYLPLLIPSWSFTLHASARQEDG